MVLDSYLMSAEPWHLVGPSLDIWFDVSGEVNWNRKVKGRKGTLLCGGVEVVMIRGVTPWTIKLDAYFQPNSRATRNTRMGSIEAAFATPGVYTLTQPGGVVRSVQFDPDQGISERWDAGARVVTFGLVQVGS